jgi:hypothetical protein
LSKDDQSRLDGFLLSHRSPRSDPRILSKGLRSTRSAAPYS